MIYEIYIMKPSVVSFLINCSLSSCNLTNRDSVAEALLTFLRQ